MDISTSTYGNRKKNKSTYYDRKLDMQGSVPGISKEETIKAFEDKYQIKL